MKPFLDEIFRILEMRQKAISLGSDVFRKLVAVRILTPVLAAEWDWRIRE